MAIGKTARKISIVLLHDTAGARNAPAPPPKSLWRCHAEYVEGNTLKEMIKKDLIAERVAIESYREMVAYIAEKRSDNTSPP